MNGYRLMRAILSPIYKFWYRPRIIGKENILSEGPIILAGNHIHLMDQCNVIISTKRKLHYMAKKEYFDDKKVAWFFRLVGCIPVDRSKKDDKAKLSALNVLRDGHALGIFPEGTRNSLKKDKLKEIYKKYFKDISYKSFCRKMKKNKKSFVLYIEELKDKGIISEEDYITNIFDVDSYLKELINKKIIKEKDYYDHILLPLKYGAVSMAQKTDSYIIPYAIGGVYKFRGKNLTVKIGKPFKVDDDLEKANKRLDKEIKNLLKEINKKSD